MPEVLAAGLIMYVIPTIALLICVGCEMFCERDRRRQRAGRAMQRNPTEFFDGSAGSERDLK